MCFLCILWLLVSWQLALYTRVINVSLQDYTRRWYNSPVYIIFYSIHSIQRFISIKIWMNIVLYFFNKFYLITFFLNCLYMHLCTSRSNWNRYRKELTWQKTILEHEENKYFMLINEEIFSFPGKEFVMLISVVYCERSCSLLVNAVLYLG